MLPSDSALVSAARAGDHAAFGVLVDRHRPRLVRLACRLLDDRAEADDVAQEACLQAYLALGELRAPERFGAWLAGIGLNLARMHRRRGRAVRLLEDWDGGRLARGFTGQGAALGQSAEALVEARELEAAIRAAIAGLPREQQAAVHEHYWNGLTVVEAGQAAGVPAGTVKARLHRARRRLRTVLASYVSAPSTIRPESSEVSMIEVIVHDVISKSMKLHDVLEAIGPLPEAGSEAERVQRPLPPGVGQSRVVLLQERDGARLLPIWVGPFEGDSIALLRAGRKTPRPMTFELMARLMEAGQMTLERVAVTRLADEVYFATLSLRAGGQAHSLDARPSDAIALALRLSAPLFVDDAVMAQNGVTPDRLSEPLGEGWQSVDPDQVFPPWKPSQK